MSEFVTKIEHPIKSGYFQLVDSPWLWYNSEVDKIVNDPRTMHANENAKNSDAQDILGMFNGLETEPFFTYEEACAATIGSRYRISGKEAPNAVAFKGHIPLMRYQKVVPTIMGGTVVEIGWVITPERLL